MSRTVVLLDLLIRLEDRAVGTWGENPDVPHGHTIVISTPPILLYPLRLPHRYYYTPPILIYHSPAAVLHPARIVKGKDAWTIFQIRRSLPATVQTLLWSQRHHQTSTPDVDYIHSDGSHLAVVGHRHASECLSELYSGAKGIHFSSGASLVRSFSQCSCGILCLLS